MITGSCYIFGCPMAADHLVVSMHLRSMHLRSMHIKMLYIVLYINAITAQIEDPDRDPPCSTVTWEDKVYTKLDTKDKLPEECAPDLIFLNEVGKGFCLEANPVEETSEISCTEGADTSVRLPTDVKPSHYNIVMDILMDESTTKGSVAITLDVLKPTRQIVLHSHHEEITIKDVNLTYGKNNEKVIPIANTLQDEPRDMLMIVFEDELQPNTEKGKSFTLSISFEGKIVPGQWGLFTAYESTDYEDYMATTQFTPMYARRTFPCFDEPALKATFSITLGRQKRFGTVSNTQTSYTTDRGGDWYWDIFEEKIINQFIHLDNIYLF